MVNYHKEFRKLLLEAGVPVYYEAFQEKTEIPCISYLEGSNTQLAKGDNLNYGSVSFLVKIWAKNIDTLIDLSSKVDNELANNGFSRVGCYERNEDGILTKSLIYRGTSFEYGGFN